MGLYYYYLLVHVEKKGDISRQAHSLLIRHNNNEKQLKRISDSRRKRSLTLNVLHR